MLRQGNVKLIGEPFPELALGAANPAGPTGPGGAIAQPGPAGSLAGQVLHGAAQFARIYGFSFEGHYYDLPKPVIMLVHGAGAALAGPPTTILESDEAARFWEFSTGLSQWNYDKMTMSIRLDIESGTLEQILLEAALTGTGGSYAGANVSGANVSGANVRGANVRGANVRGANVFGGANAWGRNRGSD
jgi:Pentapeptide repeats (8 copies)